MLPRGYGALVVLSLLARGALAQESADAAAVPQPSPSSPLDSPSEAEPPAAEVVHRELAAADEDSPWTVGVSAEDRKIARELFREGNSHFDEGRYSEALERYRQAVEHWDNPSIRFNMSRCHVYQGHPLAAWENLQKSMQYGPKGLADEKKFRLGQTFAAMLRKQLVVLDVSCTEAGATVLVSGKRLMSCPGTVSKWLEPGAHQIVGKKPGFIPYTKELKIFGGERHSIRVDMQPEKNHRPRVVRRWQSWVPWTVLGAGLSVAAAGIPLQLAANDNLDSFDAYVAEHCQSRCLDSELPTDVRSLKSRASTQQVAGIAAYAVGGVGAVLGLVMVIANRPRVDEGPTITSTGKFTGITWTF